MKHLLILFLGLLAGFLVGYLVFEIIFQKGIVVDLGKKESLTVTDNFESTIVENNIEESVPPPDDHSWLPIRRDLFRERQTHSYFIDENVSRYRVSRTNLLNVVEIWDEEEKIGTVDVSPYVRGDEIFQIWSVYTTPTASKQKEVRIYFVDASGCGGCVWPAKYFVAINSYTKEVRLEIIPNNENSLLFRWDSRYNLTPESLTLPSPSGKLVAFLPDRNDESIWIYDFVNNTEQQIFVVPQGQTILESGPDSTPWFKDTFWERLDKETLLIKSSFSPAPQEYEWNQEDGLREAQEQY